MRSLPNALRFVCVVSAVSACAAGPSFADDEVARRAKEAAREFDIFAKSLQQAAEAVISDLEKSDGTKNGLPVVDWEKEYRQPRRFVRTGHQSKIIYTQIVYKVTVYQRDYQYRVDSVQRIERTGLRQHPFSGLVRIEVVPHMRVIEKEFPQANNDIPENYVPRELTDLEARNSSPVMLEGGKKYTRVESQMPLPHGPPSVRDMAQAPDIIRKSQRNLIKQCLKAEQIPAKSVFRSISFYYSLDDLAWKMHEKESRSEGR